MTFLKCMLGLTQAVLPKLHDGACIVKISSTVGQTAIGGGHSLYGATRAPSPS